MRRVTRLLCGFPVLLATAFYVTWLAGRLSLGYWPRPSLDDPKQIEGGLMAVSYTTTAILVSIGVPAFCLVSLVAALVCIVRKPEGRTSRTTELAVAVILSAGFVLFALWDPQSVVVWFFD